MQEALDLARRSSLDISPNQEDTLKSHYRDIEQQVKSGDPRSWLKSLLPNAFLGGESAPVNDSYLQNQIIDYAKLYTRLGLGPRDAISKAQDAVRETTQMAGNWAIPKLGTQLPSGFGQAFSDYVEKFVEQNGKFNDGIGKSDIGASYNGAGTFTLVNRNGMGLRTPTGIASFTLKDLAGVSENKDAELRQKLLEAGQKRSEAAPRHLQRHEGMGSPVPEEAHAG
jgi:hypothetical protein